MSIQQLELDPGARNDEYLAIWPSGWPLSRLVFVVVLGAGYVGVGVAFLFMSRLLSLLS